MKSAKSTHTATNDPIAIVGVALRFTGDVNSLESLWEVLRSGRDLVTSNGATGVLPDFDRFDARFFSLIQDAALPLDPRHRLMLELAWEVFEDACIRPSTLAGSNCAVLVGASGEGNDVHPLGHPDGGGVANDISQVFDLRGPSMDLNAGCSSSLVALHQACEMLRTGQACSALVGGVHMLRERSACRRSTPPSSLSAQEHCRAFGVDGNGPVPAEGGALMLLKPLIRALRDGDRVHALVRASGVNADGARKPGVACTRAQGQAALIRAVLERSGLCATDVMYVETQSAETPDADAISAVYGANRPALLPIGSVMRSLGNLALASGMASVAKALGVLAHDHVPGTPRADASNRDIDNIAPGIWVPDHGIDLPSRPVRVAVNGFGSVNAHIVLEQTPGDAHAVAAVRHGPAALVISAADEGALRTLAAHHADALEQGHDPARLAQAAWERRDWLPERLALPDAFATDAVQRLRSFAACGELQGLMRERALGCEVSVMLVYAGRNAAWVGMARELRRVSALFARALAGVADLMRTFGGPDILAALDRSEPGEPDPVGLQRAGLFAVQVAVTELLRAQGLGSWAVTGRGTGRIAAAWSAGTLTLDQAARIAAQRQTKMRVRDGASATIRSLRIGAMHRAAGAGQPAPACLTLDLHPEAAVLRRTVVEIPASTGDNASGFAPASPRIESLPGIRNAVLRLALLGVAIDPRAQFPVPLCGHVVLPRYPWQRTTLADAGNALPPLSLPAAAKLAGILRQAWVSHTDLARHRDGEDGAPLRELLPLAYARDALLASGHPDPARIESWHQGHPLLRWLLEQLRTQKVLRAAGTGWQLDAAALPPTAEIWHAALATYPAAAPELLRLGQVGTGLARLVETPSLQDAPASLPDAHAPPYAATRTALALALDALAQHWPAGRPMRVLDVGHGDGRDLTDMCDACAVDSRLTVASLPVISLASIPMPAQFDVVILDHALHRIAQPAQALESLLRAQGTDVVIVLAERHPDQAAVFTEGTHAGWWRTDAGGLPHPPLLTPGAWEAMLRHIGWTDCQSVLDPAAAGLAIGGFVTIARAGSSVKAVEDAHRPDSIAVDGAGETRPLEPSPFCLHVAQPGVLSRLEWRPCLRRPPGPGEVEVEVRATGLNVGDLLLASGKRDHAALAPGAAASMGTDIAGLVTRCGIGVQRFQAGDAVLGFASAGLASHAVVAQLALRPKPVSWSFAEAATVPTVFFTVWYALAEVARVRPGERILVHGAGGGVGLATLQIARRLGAEVIAAAGDPSRRDFVRLMGATHCVDSRDPSLVDTVLACTSGDGVDVILNTLARDAATRSLGALRPFGRFIDLHKHALQGSPTRMPRAFADTISHDEVDPDALMQRQPALATRMFDDIMAAFAAGDLHPLPPRIFKADRVIDAFQLLQQACHIGKVVVDLESAPHGARCAQARGTPAGVTSDLPRGTDT